MSYNLFLDDFRLPKDAFSYTGEIRYNKLEWEIVRSFDEFVEFIEKRGMPILVSFDHDLADEHYGSADYDYPHGNGIDYQTYVEKTGYECAKWLCEYCLNNNKEFPEYLVHSFNHIGAMNIMAYINNFKKHQKIK